jgi:HEPN domain-containing protein
MIPTDDLLKIAEARLKDAGALLANRRYDGAIYLCGYAVELTLKARICKTLNWLGYPSTRKEFSNYSSFKTHDLDVLLHLSGRESNIKLNFFTEWSAVAQWEPSTRYQPVGTADESDARLMISATKVLLGEI